MSMRASHSKIDALGVKDLVWRLFELGKSYDEIAAEVARATGGQRVSAAALSRERGKWSIAKANLDATRAQMRAFVEAFKRHPELNFEDAGMALLLEKLVTEIASVRQTFRGASLLQLGHLLLKAHRARAATKAIDLQEERLAVLKQRVAQAAEKVAQAARAKGLDPETLRTIREEIYGIAA